MHLKNKRIIRILKFLLVGASLGVLFYFSYCFLGLDKITKEDIEAFILSTNGLAPLIYLLICFLQVTILPIPSSLTIVVGTVLFGPFSCFIYSFIGVLTGSIFAYFLGKTVGIKIAYFVAGEKEIVNNYLDKLKGKEVIMLFFMFLFPFFPDDLLCIIAGLLQIKFKTFVLMQLISRMISISAIIFISFSAIISFSVDVKTIIILLTLIIITFTLFFLIYKSANKICYKDRK